VKILQLLTHGDLQPGGAVQAYRLGIELARRGHDVTLLYSPKKPARRLPADRFAELEQAGVAIADINLRSLASLLRLRAFLKRGDFDVVHAHRERAISRLLRATIGMPRPILFANRGNTYPLTRRERAELAHPRYRKIVAVAQAVKRVLVRDGIDPDKVAVVYGGVDAEAFSPEVDGSAVRRELFPDNPDAPIVGMLANLDRKKSHDVFLRMAARILERRPETRFAAVGRGKTEKFSHLIDDLGLRGKVIFPGYRSDAAATLAAFGVSVSTASEGEGLTGAIRESLALARPVVATDVGGNREIIHNGETGLLVPPRDPDALAKAVSRLLDNPSEATEMGRRGRRLVVERFSLSARGDAIEALYSDALRFDPYTLRRAK